jgi:superfamily II DNA or RNA helicase
MKTENVIYAYTTKSYKDLLKVGQTYLREGMTAEESAKLRIAQQDSTSNPEPLILKHVWTVPGHITDKRIHKQLILMGKTDARKDKDREWFKCNVTDVASAINSLVHGIERPNSFEPRKEQSDCVDKAVSYFNKGGEEFLVNAKMRFGKTFVSYLIAKEMNAKSILVVTYIPAVNSSWQEDLDTHIKFDGWHYSTGNGFELNKKAKVNVVFASFQDLNEFNKTKWKGILQHYFDMVVIDEMHYGSETERAKFTLSNLNYDHALFVSGTPLDAVISGRFTEDNMFTWSYADEQKKRRLEEESGWKTETYRWLPPMEIHTFEVCADAKKACLAYTGEEQFTMTKMFGSDNGIKFNDEPTVKLFLDQVFGRGSVKKVHSPIRTCAADHMLFVMPPNVKSVNAFCNLLDQMVGEEYHIINVAGNNIKSLAKVKKAIRQNSKTVTVTCGRFNTGVTVPEWDAVFMLGDGAAPETYFQTIFRVQSPDKRRGKEKCYVFDFNPERVLELVYTYAELTAKKNQSTKSTLREFLDFAPIIDHSGNKTKIVDTESIVSFVTDNGNYLDKFASSYLWNKEQATNFTNLLQLNGAVVNTKSQKNVNSNGLDKGKNYLNLKKGLKGQKTEKDLVEQILEKAKIVTKNIPAYVMFVDHVESVRQLMKTDSKTFEQQFEIPLICFKDMIESKFLNEDRLNRLITGLKEVA